MIQSQLRQLRTWLTYCTKLTTNRQKTQQNPATSARFQPDGYFFGWAFCPFIGSSSASCPCCDGADDGGEDRRRHRHRRRRPSRLPCRIHHPALRPPPGAAWQWPFRPRASCATWSSGSGTKPARKRVD